MSSTGDHYINSGAQTQEKNGADPLPLTVPAESGVDGGAYPVKNTDRLRCLTIVCENAEQFNFIRNTHGLNTVTLETLRGQVHEIDQLGFINSQLAREYQRTVANKHASACTPQLTCRLLSPVPLYMTGLRQWVLWRSEERTNKAGVVKLTKVPYNFLPMAERTLNQSNREPKTALEEKASSNRPDTWGDYYQAKTIAGQLRLDGISGGIGFMFAEGDGIVGMDLDKCIDPDDPGRQINTEMARAIFERFRNTYMEYSPSGRGYHIFALGFAVRAKGNANTRNRESDNSGLEIYGETKNGHSNRFFTITEKTLSSPGKLANAQEKLEWLDETFVAGSTKEIQNYPAREISDNDYDIDDIKDALNYISGDEYEHYTPWLNIGFSLHHFGIQNNCNEEMLKQWIGWSSKLNNFDEEECRDKWQSFGSNESNSRTIDSLFYDARNKHGYTPKLDPQSMFGDLPLPDPGAEEEENKKVVQETPQNDGNKEQPTEARSRAEDNGSPKKTAEPPPIYCCATTLMSELEPFDPPGVLMTFKDAQALFTKGRSITIFERKKDEKEARNLRTFFRNIARPSNVELIGATSEQYLQQIRDFIDQKQAAMIEETVEETVEEPSKSRNEASILLAIAECLIRDQRVIVFLNPSGEVYVTFPYEFDEGRHCYETFPIDSREFRAFLRKRYRKRTRRVCGNDALKIAIDNLAGETRKVREVHIRVAHYKECVYVDLADRDQVVKIEPGSWSLISVNACPVTFYRPRGTKPHPKPVLGGSLDALRQFTNATSDDNLRRVILAVASAYSAGPQLAVEITGQNGSAKTFTAKAMRLLIDPNEGDSIGPPKDADAFLLACINQYVIIIDNLSKISISLSDAMCRVASGTAQRSRKLYTDQEEVINRIRRPLIITAINSVITRPDLSERRFKIPLEPILKEDRKTEQEIISGLQSALPSLLGAVFSTVAGALAEIPHITPDYKLPRMADAAKFLFAVERHLEWKKGTVAKIFEEEAIELANDLAEYNAFIPAIIELVKSKTKEQTPWIVPGKEVIEEFRMSGKIPDVNNEVPDTAKKLGIRLNAYGTVLRTLGLSYKKASGGDLKPYTFMYKDPVPTGETPEADF